MPGKKKRKNGNKKGKVGELELAKFLTSLGLQSRRTQQYCGATGDASDVLCKALPDFHIESKRTEALRLYAAIDQARNDAHGKTPVVFHRMNHRPWVVIMEADLFIGLLKKAGLVTYERKDDSGASDLRESEPVVASGLLERTGDVAAEPRRAGGAGNSGSAN